MAPPFANPKNLNHQLKSAITGIMVVLDEKSYG
jgi:hypothetical protein